MSSLKTFKKRAAEIDFMRLKGAKESILETIGNTPLIRLQQASKDLNTNIYAKLESFNPGHSAKDRIALYAIEKAEKEGKLSPGGTVIESTSGNTGRSLAMVAALKGYKCVLFTTTKISFEKKALMEAYGAQVVICPKEAHADHPESYYERAKTLHAATPNSVYINQYYNNSNVEAHYALTGPEIWDQTEGKITHYVACVGSGGTISGTSKFLKEQNSDIRVLGVDAYGSVLTKYHTDGVLDESEIKPYKLEGVGKSIIPGSVLFQNIDKFYQVDDKPSLLRARELARTEAIMPGPSGGAAVEALYQMKDEFTPDSVVVVILPDHGAGYLSKLYNTQWMSENNFLNRVDYEPKTVEKSGLQL